MKDETDGLTNYWKVNTLVSTKPYVKIAFVIFISIS